MAERDLNALDWKTCLSFSLSLSHSLSLSLSPPQMKKSRHSSIQSWPTTPLHFPMAQSVKNLPAKETQIQSLCWKDPLRREWIPTPVFLPGEFHGQRSLVSYSPWGCKGLDTAEQLTLSYHSATE